MAPSDPIALPQGVAEEAVDELYALPLDEFTPRRDELAKELRATAKRDGAAWVKALPKPSAAAWLVNQLARTQKSDARRMLEKGDALRVAQERALARQASREELARATQEHAEAMRTLLSKAPGFLDRRGAPPSQITLERAAETLRAILLDDAVRAAFAAGRLTREHRTAGLGFAVSGRATVAPASPAKSTKPGKRPKGDASAAAAKEAQRRAQERARAQAVAIEARSATAPGSVTCPRRKAPCERPNGSWNARSDGSRRPSRRSRAPATRRPTPGRESSRRRRPPAGPSPGATRLASRGPSSHSAHHRSARGGGSLAGSRHAGRTDVGTLPHWLDRRVLRRRRGEMPAAHKILICIAIRQPQVTRRGTALSRPPSSQAQRSSSPRQSSALSARSRWATSCLGRGSPCR